MKIPLQSIFFASILSLLGSLASGQTVTCPPGAIPEGEPCGADSNGGCDATPSLFQPIDFGETVCGTAWAQNGFRDTDWYQKVLAETSEVNWIVQSEFGFEMGIFDSSCSYDTMIAVPFAYADTLAALLSPGTYNFFVRPFGGEGPPFCDGQNLYFARLLPCLKGDVYPRDGFLTGADVVTMAHCVYLPYPPEEASLRCRLCNADVNCDGIFSPSDYVLELNFVYLDEPLPCQ